MHEALHVAVLLTTVLGAGGLALLALWPIAFESPIPPRTKRGAAALVALAAAFFLLEWLVVH